jgi:hypothetical protein
VIIHLLGCFGVKKFKLKELSSGFEKVIGSKNVPVRAMGIQIYEELYKFMKDGVMGLVEKLEKREQEELKKSFERMAKEGVTAPEVKKSIITDRVNNEEAKGEAQGGGAEDDASFDPYEFADEKDCLAAYNEEWAEKVLACPKWDGKRDLLQVLEKDCAATRLKPYDTSSIVTCLKKTLTDSNVVVCSLSIKICGNLAKALRQNFKESAKALILPLLKKYSEKKTQIITENTAAL